MQLVNGALFLNAKNLFRMSIKSLPFVFVGVIVPFSTIYASLKSHRSYHSVDVLNLICVLVLYPSSALPDLSSTSIHFLGTNLGKVFDSKFVIFWYSIIIWG